MKRIFFIIIFCVVVLAFSIEVKAATACTLHSSICGDVTEVNTSMMTAKLAYQFMGYSTVSYTDPTDTALFSNILTRNVQLYFADGDITKVVFQNGGITTGETGTVGIRFEKDSPEIELPFYSIYDLNWNDKKLITLATCKSAGESQPSTSSLTYQIANEGAQMTVGWYGTVNNESLPNWLNYYHERLAEGDNPYDAVNYANSKFYVYPSVRNTYVVYNALTSLSIEEISELKLVDDKDTLISNNILSQNEAAKYNFSQIEEILMEKNPDFNINNYQIKESNTSYSTNLKDNKIKEDYTYIDYVYKIGDFITNSAYTVILDSNDKILSINDNTIKKDDNVDVFLLSDNFTVSDSQRTHNIQKAQNNYDDKSIIEDTEVIFYYDLNTRTKYAIVTIETETGVYETYKYII